MSNFWHFYLYPLLKSPATTTVIAFTTAIGAFFIYFLRRRDFKKDAANIIVLELKSAEKNIAEANKVYLEAKANNPGRIVFPEKLRLMKTESWTKYKYMFARDLSTDGWRAIGEFYEYCQNFDEAVEHKDNGFNRNEKQILSGIHKNIAVGAYELAGSLAANPDNNAAIDNQNKKKIAEMKDKLELAENLTLAELISIYNPDKSFKDAEYAFSLIDKKITGSEAGQALRKIARRPGSTFIRWLLRSKEP